METKTGIVDVHAHIFPDELAGRAVKRLHGNSGEPAFTDGTAAGLEASMRAGGISWAVTQPVSTKGSQTPVINAWAIRINRPPLISFGTLHPDYADNPGELRKLKAAGIRGIKFHPDYQKFFVDEERLFPLYQAVADAGLLAFIHAGVDLGLGPPYHCPPDRLVRVLERVPKLVVIAAHFGGFQMWDEVERLLIGRNLYLDTSYTLSFLPRERFVAMARRHGIGKLLFGTDSPWADQGAEVKLLRATGLTEAELQVVCFDNAARLLDLPRS